jgi:hypothetical protein
VAPLNYRSVSLVTVSLLACAAAGTFADAAAAAGVTVRVEGKSRTLLAQTAPLTGLTKVMRDGHLCSATTGAAALQRATRGNWSGSWSSSLSDFEVLKIKGETDSYSTTKSYWEVFVNDTPASTGICGMKLKGSENILFAAVGNTEKPGDPIGIVSAMPASGGTPGSVKVVAYSAKGKAAPLAGATVTVNGKSAGTTNAQGVASIPSTATGKLDVVVSKTGYIRDEQEVQS